MKTVLLTGCSSGIGAATALYFAEQGWNVIATMRDPRVAKDLANRCQVLVTALDLQDPSSIATAVQAGLTRFGRIDVLVNNAGFGLYGAFEATPREKIMEQFAVNLFGTMDVTRALLPHFRKMKSGTIINLSSGAGVHALPLFSLYCASKFALEGFSEALALELADQNILVKLVEPGGVLNTSFADRRRAEIATLAEIPAYQPYAGRCGKIYARLRDTPLASVDDVVREIFSAATDGTAQLRYVVREEVQPLFRARREMTEADYWEYLRRTFP